MEIRLEILKLKYDTPEVLYISFKIVTLIIWWRIVPKSIEYNSICALFKRYKIFLPFY